MTKKLIALVLALSMAMTMLLAGCASNPSTEGSTPPESQSGTETKTPDDNKDPAPAGEGRVYWLNFKP